ncbi:hypothetical protein CP061683_0725, partial [Chlamydia psittaci 06-1683]
FSNLTYKLILVRKILLNKLIKLKLTKGIN